MTRLVGVGSLLGFFVAAGMGLAGVAAGEPPPREPLDALWEHHLLEGKSSSVAVEVKDSKVSTSETSPPKMTGLKTGMTALLFLAPHGIIVRQLGDGFWGNGGWILQGGLLDQVNDGPSIIQLYVKEVQHQHPYFPFPFHREIPHETGYEFFLLQRKAGVPGATIIRKWVFLPQDVVVAHHSTGGTYEDVRGLLRYEATSRIANVKITGLKRPFDERVDLSSALESAPRK